MTNVPYPLTTYRHVIVKIPHRITVCMSFFRQTNTFQCVLATSPTVSFVIFLYADGEIQWSNNALAGINVGDGVNSITIPGSLTPNINAISQTGNVGIPGIWMFEVGTGIEGNVCVYCILDMQLDLRNPASTHNYKYLKYQF